MEKIRNIGITAIVAGALMLGGAKSLAESNLEATAQVKKTGFMAMPETFIRKKAFENGTEQAVEPFFKYMQGVDKWLQTNNQSRNYENELLDDLDKYQAAGEIKTFKNGVRQVSIKRVNNEYSVISTQLTDLNGNKIVLSQWRMDKIPTPKYHPEAFVNLQVYNWELMDKLNPMENELVTAIAPDGDLDAVQQDFRNYLINR